MLTCNVSEVTGELAAIVVVDSTAVDPKGSVPRLRLIAPGKVDPPTGVTLSVNTARPVGGTVAAPAPETASVKSCTVTEIELLVAGP